MKTTKIKITTMGGLHAREVEGVRVGNWAAHESHDGPGWRVSHVPSGLGTYALADDIEPTDAVRIARRIERTFPDLQVVGSFYEMRTAQHRYAGLDVRETVQIIESIFAEELAP